LIKVYNKAIAIFNFFIIYIYVLFNRNNKIYCYILFYHNKNISILYCLIPLLMQISIDAFLALDVIIIVNCDYHLCMMICNLWFACRVNNCFIDYCLTIADANYLSIADNYRSFILPPLLPPKLLAVFLSVARYSFLYRSLLIDFCQIDFFF
jgi:hypothetical protein